MPRLTDLSTIRRLLETDRPWSLYPLGDLAPQRLPYCTWLHAPGAEPALVLLYREFGTPVFFALGPPNAVRAILEEVDEPKLYLHVRPEIVELLQPRYRIEQEDAMWRMLLEPARFSPCSTEGVVPLTPRDLDALRRLYADGEPVGEAPHFFFPAMLEDGAFFGIWERNELSAAGGTHLVVPAEGVAAVGNIYTRRSRRGRGLAARVTSAVVTGLRHRELRTIALNVNQRNETAIRVYERLGFARYCAFREGVAVRAASHSG